MRELLRKAVAGRCQVLALCVQVEGYGTVLCVQINYGAAISIRTRLRLNLLTPSAYAMQTADL